MPHFFHEQFPQFLPAVVYPLAVLGINDEYEALRPGVVVSPQWADLILATDVPHIELDVFIRHSLNIEANCVKHVKSSAQGN